MFWLILQAAVVGAPAPATLSGRVVDASSGRPLASAVVTLVDLRRSAYTSTEGRYVFTEVPPGPQHLLVRSLGYAPQSLHALVPGRGALSVDVSLVTAPRRLTPVLVASVPARTALTQDAGRPERMVDAAAMAASPLRSEPDALSSLGGGWVRAGPESPDGLYVRGGASDQVTYHLGGIPVINPYHTAGLFGGWNPDALRQVTLTSARPDAWAPLALSATVGGDLRSPGSTLEVIGASSTTHARVAVSGPLGLADAGFLASGRTAFPGWLSRAGDGSFLRGGAQDWLGMIEAPLGGGKVRVLGFMSEDLVNLQASADINGGPSGDRRRHQFEWGTGSVGATWDMQSSGDAWRVAAWRARGDVEGAWIGRDGRLGLASARGEAGVAASFARTGARSAMRLATRVERLQTQYDVRGASPDALLAAQRDAQWMVTTLAEREWWFRRAWYGQMGGTATGGLSGLRVGPHAAFGYQAGNGALAEVAWRRSHQFAQSVRNAESLVGNVFPADLHVLAGDLGMPVASGDLVVARAGIQRTRGWHASAQWYARDMRGLALVAPVEREPFATQAIAEGRGVARGASLDAGFVAPRWNASLVYGRQRVVYQTGSVRYVPAHAPRHTVEAGTTIFPSPTTVLRLGMVGEAGRRATAPSGDFEWESCNLKDRGCEFGGTPGADGGPLGALRLPGYARADVGLSKHWHVGLRGRDARVTVYGTFSNVIGRMNVLTYATDPHTGRPVPIEMRPRSPLVLGMDWRY